MSQSGAGAGTAVLFLCHFVNSEILQRFRMLRRALAGRHDVYFAVHLTGRTSERHIPASLVGPRLFCFTTAMLRRLPYRRAREGWDGDSPVPGRVDLVPQLFRRLHPGYERIYLVEYDVLYRGDWAALFAALERRPADLLATNLSRQDENPGWHFWPSLEVGPLPPERRVRGLLCFCRYSRRALDLLDLRYRQGWLGHGEGLVPTALYDAGLTIEDLGGEGPFVPPGQERRHYWSDRLRSEPPSPGCFVFRPEQEPSGSEAWLWHPVKTSRKRHFRDRLRTTLRGHLHLERFLARDPRYRRLDSLLPP